MRRLRLAACGLLTCCAVEDRVGTLVLDPTTDASAPDAASAADAAVDAGDAGSVSRPDGGPNVGCQASSPLVPWNAAAAPFGLCACSELTASDAVTVADAAAVGGAAFLQGALTAGRGFWVGGRLGATAAGDVTARELYASGALDSEAEVRVQRLVGLGAGARARRIEAPLGLQLPAGAALQVDELAATVERQPLPALATCDCSTATSGDPLLGRGQAPPSGSGALELPCGPLRAGNLIVDAATTWRVVGATQLYVAGDVTLNADLTVEIDPGARLDWVVGGNVVAAGALILGGPDGGAAHLRVEGSGTLQLSGGGRVAGDLDAPAARLVTSGPLVVDGRLRAESIAAGAALTVQGPGADPSAGQSCQRDLDCRAPAICTAPTCTP